METGRDLLVAEVGEPPDIPETDGDRDAGEEEVKFAAEGSPLSILVLRDNKLRGFLILPVQTPPQHCQQKEERRS